MLWLCCRMIARCRSSKPLPAACHPVSVRRHVLLGALSVSSPLGGHITPSQFSSLHLKSGAFGLRFLARLSHIGPSHFGQFIMVVHSRPNQMSPCLQFHEIRESLVNTNSLVARSHDFPVVALRRENRIRKCRGRPYP